MPACNALNCPFASFNSKLDEANVVSLSPTLLPFLLHMSFDTFKCLDLKAFSNVAMTTPQSFILHDPKRQFDQLIYRSREGSFAPVLMIIALH
jgi:hypothetical protein